MASPLRLDVVSTRMADERFEVRADDGTRLAGTLTRPGSEVVPAALLMNGSGPLDRDSNMPGQALHVADALAAALAERGVASLRYDKRGVGESDGVYLETSFDRETDDAASALVTLRAASGVDPDRVSIVGHSAGATIAIRLAARYEWVAGAVLLAAAIGTGAEVMRVQSERIAASLRGLQRLGAKRFLRGQERAREALLASVDDVVHLEDTELPALWFREYMAYDPGPDLSAIRCPVLAITGRKDLQVEPADVARMGERVRGPFTGLTPDRLTHVLRKDSKPPSLSRYRAQLRHPVDPELLATVADWVAARS